MSKTIRRSSARNLPPSADGFVPPVISSDVAPKAGTQILVMAPCGVALKVRVREAQADSLGWAGWADVISGKEQDLRDAGVPTCDSDLPMRIFSWQVVGNEYK